MTKNLVWILGDQLLKDHPALADADVVVLVESQALIQRRPYHPRKLTLLLSAMRHYAVYLTEAGYEVDYIKDQSTLAGLQQAVKRHQPQKITTMAASAYHGRQWQQVTLSKALEMPVDVLPNSQFLVNQFQPDVDPNKKVIMEYFYRDMRRHFDILIEADGEPTGGQWNFDKDNRASLPKKASPPALPSFEPDSMTREVMEQVGCHDFDLAVTHSDAAVAFDDFLQHRFALFGKYEDAMSHEHATLWHSVLSPYLNIGLLEPQEMVKSAVKAYQAGDAPINSVEGFIRQILGWREFMYWQYWRLMPDLLEMNAWEAHRTVPEFFWSGQTDMNCLRQVLGRVKQTGYAHHIERLMLLSNFAILTGLNPFEVNEWFLSLFIDAYDWVMAPNVIGMGLNADGGIIATKPYVASANYINKMGDYCKHCPLNHKSRTGDDACPFNFLYWNFLIKHEEKLRSNPRLGRNVLGLRHLDDEEREAVQAQADAFLNALG